MPAISNAAGQHKARPPQPPATRQPGPNPHAAWNLPFLHPHPPRLFRKWCRVFQVAHSPTWKGVSATIKGRHFGHEFLISLSSGGRFRPPDPPPDAARGVVDDDVRVSWLVTFTRTPLWSGGAWRVGMEARDPGAWRDLVLTRAHRPLRAPQKSGSSRADRPRNTARPAVLVGSGSLRGEGGYALVPDDAWRATITAALRSADGPRAARPAGPSADSCGGAGQGKGARSRCQQTIVFVSHHQQQGLPLRARLPDAPLAPAQSPRRL